MRHRWQALVIVIFALLAWEALARWEIVSTLFFPAPTRIASTLVELGRSGQLAQHLGISMLRVTLGFLLGSSAGLIIGWLTGWLPKLRYAMDPLVAAAHPLPKVSLLPLMLVIFGLGERANIFVVAAAAFFPLMISTMAGVREIPRIYFEVAESFGASPGTIFRRVVVPGSMPAVLTGVRLAVNVALLVTVSVELVSTDRGLGNRIWFAWQTFRTEELWAYLFVISLLGIILMTAVGLTSRLLTPWKYLEDDAAPTTARDSRIENPAYAEKEMHDAV